MLAGPFTASVPPIRARTRRRINRSEIFRHFRLHGSHADSRQLWGIFGTCGMNDSGQLERFMGSHFLSPDLIAQAVLLDKCGPSDYRLAGPDISGHFLRAGRVVAMSDSINSDSLPCGFLDYRIGTLRSDRLIHYARPQRGQIWPSGFTGQNSQTAPLLNNLVLISPDTNVSCSFPVRVSI